MTCFCECSGPLPIAISKNSLKLDQEVKVYEVWMIAQTLNSLELSCSRKKNHVHSLTTSQYELLFKLTCRSCRYLRSNQLSNSKVYMSQVLKIVIGVFNYYCNCSAVGQGFFIPPCAVKTSYSLLLYVQYTILHLWMDTAAWIINRHFYMSCEFYYTERRNNRYQKSYCWNKTQKKQHWSRFTHLSSDQAVWSLIQIVESRWYLPAAKWEWPW